MSPETPLFLRSAAAYVRGKLAKELPPRLIGAPLDQLTAADWQELVELGRRRELRLHRFKCTMGLPRVDKVLGALRGLQPAELLDVGSGRGAFLWPLIDAFPELPVTSVDLLPHRIADLEAARCGGLLQLSPILGDIAALDFPDGSFDGVTLLEVLEHIPEPKKALARACALLRRFLILSVPSKPDSNPEHLHLFDQASLESWLRENGAHRIQFDGVPGHRLAIATFRHPAAAA